MAGAVGFEPTHADTKKPVPYRLATPHQELMNLSEIKRFFNSN